MSGSFVNARRAISIECRGSKKNSKSVPHDLQRLAPEQGLAAVDEVTVVPNLHSDSVQPEAGGQDHDCSGSRINFKDLSISVHPDDESEEDCDLLVHSGGNSDQNSMSSPGSATTLTVRFLVAGAFLYEQLYNLQFFCFL
jgi:hypothetical protein